MSDPTEEGNKTVFRPSPLQGRKLGQTNFPGRPGASPSSTGAAPAAPQQPVWSAPAAAAPTPSGPEDSPGTTALAPPRAGGPALLFDSPAGERHNILLAEANPVLALVAAMRPGPTHAAPSQLREQAVAAITAFDQSIASLYSADVRQRARHALAATVDDAAQTLPDEGGKWPGGSMVTQFGGDSSDGERFWQQVDDALTTPADNRDLIELYQVCLAAGYKGSYRGTPDGDRRLQEVTARLQGGLTPARPVAAQDVKPAAKIAQAKGVTASRGKRSPWRAVLMILVVALILVLVGYVALRLLAPDVIPAQLRLSGFVDQVTVPAAATQAHG